MRGNELYHPIRKTRVQAKREEWHKFDMVYFWRYASVDGWVGMRVFFVIKLQLSWKKISVSCCPT